MFFTEIMDDVVRSPLIYQIYAIIKYLPVYKFTDVMKMPYMLKELLYHSILYDHGTSTDSNQDDNFIDLDNASLNQIEEVLGGYKK